LTVRTLIQGSGTTLTKSDALAANFVLYFWQGKSSSLKANTFTSSPTVIGGTMLPGLESALIGKKVGSRILAVTAPTVTFPSASPPSALVTKTLVKGKGAKVAKGDYVIAQYAGFIWRTKKVFGSSWSSGSPFGFTIGASPEQVIPGWDKGLVGQTIGSRVMLSIPPAQGYGSSGASQAGIKGNDTLLFVVDIIDALKQG